MESAALQRYFDGLSLATSESDRFTGALYVLGYTAEILVKTAYYRVRGAGPADDVAAELRGMPARARYLGLDWQGNRHNLENLAELLVNERAFGGFAMDALFAAEFQAHVSNVGAHWSEVLRYKGTVAFESELVAVFESVEWLVDNHAQLWS
jgi:G3E family GTPase